MLDEPTAGIDVSAKDEIYQAIDRLAARGVGIIVVSSELPELLGLSDRVLVMADGALVGRYAREDASEEQIMRAIQFC